MSDLTDRFQEAPLYGATLHANQPRKGTSTLTWLISSPSPGLFSITVARKMKRSRGYSTAALKTRTELKPARTWQVNCALPADVTRTSGTNYTIAQYRPSADTLMLVTTPESPSNGSNYYTVSSMPSSIYVPSAEDADENIFLRCHVKAGP